MLGATQSVELNKNNLIEKMKRLCSIDSELLAESPIFPFSITTAFFDERMAQAFPGIRGVEWITDAATAVYRLSILLSSPLIFRVSNLKNSWEIPIWWWRGSENNQISAFEIMSDKKCLMNITELKISKIGVYRSTSYSRNFVYVECDGEKQTGICKITEEDVKRQIEYFGYAWEEYGISGDRIFSRREYDDGATIINGKVIDIRANAEPRVRYLSKYNFILAPHDTPINSLELESILENILNGILNYKNKIEEIVNIIEKAPLRKYE